MTVFTGRLGRLEHRAPSANPSTVPPPAMVRRRMVPEQRGEVPPGHYRLAGGSRGLEVQQDLCHTSALVNAPHS
jgi:hypothetical protein